MLKIIHKTRKYGVCIKFDLKMKLIIFKQHNIIEILY